MLVAIFSNFATRPAGYLWEVKGNFPKCIFQTVFLKTVFFKAVSFQLCNPARGYLWGAKGEEGGISRQLVIVNLTPQVDII